MFNVQLTTDTTLYVSQIIDNLHDLAQYFGADTEEMVNYAQLHFKSSHRQREWLTVRAMLRHALGPDARIEYEENGKPILKFNAQLRDSRERQSSMFNVQCSMFNAQLRSSRENLHLLSAKPVQILQASSRTKCQCSMVSISHSKSHAALLLSSHRNIGVDIEQISERILRLADRIAQPDELPSDWQSLTPEQQARHLTTLWTIKEALYKSLDHQDGIDLLKLSIPQSFDKVILNGQLQSSRENFIGGRAVSKKQGCFLGAGRYKEVRERSVNCQSSKVNLIELSSNLIAVVTPDING